MNTFRWRSAGTPSPYRASARPTPVGDGPGTTATDGAHGGTT